MGGRRKHWNPDTRWGGWESLDPFEIDFAYDVVVDEWGVFDHPKARATEKTELKPLTRSRLTERVERLTAPYTVEFYRHKLKHEWKTRTPKADIEARQKLAKAIYTLTYRKKKRHLYCLLLGIKDPRRFDRLKEEGKKLSQ